MSNFDDSTNSTTWTMVDFVVDLTDAELVADTLWSLGVVAIEETTNDGNVTLRTSMGENPQDTIASLRETFPHVEVSTVEIDRAVADTWREFAEPTHIVDDVYLVPAWKDAPPGSRAIFIEPLDTFGLGNHPTTVLALRLALRYIQPRSTVFDFGSGSGVLAVGAASLLLCTCSAYDIADSAKDALSVNAAKNNVTTCNWIPGFPAKTVDAVLANILAPVLIAESLNVMKTTATGGVIVLSGMRTEQVAEVLRHYSQCTELTRNELDGWTAVALKKN